MKKVKEQVDLGGRLDAGLEILGQELGGDTRRKLLEYLALLEKWNRMYSLTAIRDMTRAVSVHLLDSLAVVPHVRGKRILDVGSGPGLPGIPIALARPEVRVTLLDSSHKKAAFLRQAVAELPLKNAEVRCERIENWQSETRFDCVISRAFSEISVFVESAAHVLEPSGILAAMKGVHPYDEIERLPAGFRVRDVIPLQVPMLNAERHLVLIETA